MELYSNEWAAQGSDFNTLLQQLQSDDIMFVYEGVSQLRNQLSVAQENQLQRFPLDQICKRLVEIMKQPAVMDISNEIKFMGIQCLNTIIDIFPTHIPHLIAQGLLIACCETMQQSTGFVELAEECIRIFERMSLESPRPVLKSGALLLCLNMIDFFDNNVQSKILSLLFNVSQYSDTEADFEIHFMPVLPFLCQMINSGIGSDNDRLKLEKLSTIVVRITESFTIMHPPQENFEQVGIMYDKLSNSGVLEAVIENLRNYSNYVQATTQVKPESNSDQMIITNNARTSTEATISNFLKVLRFASQFSQQVFMQLILGNVFEILEPILPLKSDQDHNQLLSDVLGLLNELLPISDDFGSEDIQISASQKLIFSNSKIAKYMESSRKLENEKLQFLKGQEEWMHKQLSMSILPKIFTAYSQNISTDFRTLCLNCIDKSLQVIPHSLLTESLDPSSFTKFIQIILKTHQPQQVLCCLKMVQKLLMSKIDLSIYFVRNGIRESILYYTQAELIEEMNNYQSQRIKPKQQEAVGMKSLFMSMATGSERDRLFQRVTEIKALMESLPPGNKREEVLRTLTKYEEGITLLDSKMKELKKDDEDPIQPADNPKYGDKISELALTIREKYFDNTAFWSDVEKTHPQMFKWIHKLTKVAKDIISDAMESNFSPESTVKVIRELCEILTSELGLTSFEFEHSGLLKAVRIFLTMPAGHAKAYCALKDEENKSNKDVVSKRDAKAFILRLRAFAQLMLTRQNGKIPFKTLIRACHEQLTTAEPLIFKDTNQDYQSQVEALRQLSKPVVINLVYEPATSTNESQPLLHKAKSVALPFASLQSTESQKSLLYLKRHSLYEELKSIPLNIQKCDNVWLLEDFLLKRIRTKQDVQKLVEQTRMPGTMFKSSVPDSDKELERMSLKQKKLYQACIEHMIDLLDECDNELSFQERVPQFVVEMTEIILGEKDALGDHFYEMMKEEIAQLIKESHQDYMEGVEMSDEEMAEENEESRDYSAIAIIQAKTQSFIDLIDQIKLAVNSVSEKPDLVMKEEINSDEDDVEMSEEQKDDPLIVTQLAATLPKKDKLPIKVSLQQPEAESTIEDLLKQREGDDIEVMFFHNGKRLNLNHSIYEIFKEPEVVPQASVKEMMAQLQTGLIPGYKTITFQIIDKPVSLHKPRGDSLIEYIEQKRVRTKSVFVDDISASSLNNVVNSLITEQFAVFNFGEEQAGTEQLVHALSVLKVMYFFYKHGSMLTNQGLNFLLLKTTSVYQEEFDLLSQIKIELNPGLFYHAKLDSNLQKAIQDPYQLVSGGISNTLRGIFNSCAFLFPFETKQLFFRLVSFIGVDIYRSLYFLRQHMKRTNRIPSKQTAGEREDKMPKMGRQKVKVNRENLLEDCLQIMKQLQKRTLLEVEFVKEEGTGLGPTLEFYTLISQMLRKDQTLWRLNVPDDSLYPKPINTDSKLICEKFQLAGVFVAKSITDSRLIDLPLSKIMWDLLLGKKKNLFDLMHLDKNLFNLFSELQVMANRKQEIDEMLIDHEMRLRLLSQVKSSKGASVEDFCLYFYDPANENIELIKDGKTVAVELSNLQHYIDLVLDSIFNSSVGLQLRAFKKGFSSVLPIETLRIFESQEELESLICGIANDDQEWQSLAKLQECVVTAHGYNEKSRPVKDFIRYLTELEPKMRPMFLRFVTGSPRLPIGGFASLEPHLTVVLKKPLNIGDSPDLFCPSVMTCQNYIKMPEYSSYEVLKNKFDYAIQNGMSHFSLS